MGADGRLHESPTPGTLGGHRRQRIYGRLDCPAALRALARGGYRSRRVFFADEPAAVAAGYRPCATCLPDAYRNWRATPAVVHEQDQAPPPRRGSSRRS
ncbi:Ada metal-binding domain-containing protein [Geodermatophilus ruber]|uniref:Ada metal-binding domain-containing protein n=1 Tax=Geodermatophilus ruber TaxID=504800 RepID=UPI000B824D2E|nr:Ada metal-binding domain-containing protein [Geodermatophilus ruber]